MTGAATPALVVLVFLVRRGLPFKTRFASGWCVGSGALLAAVVVRS